MSYDYDISISIVAYKTNPSELEWAIGSCMNTSLRTEVIVIDNSPSEKIGNFCRSLGATYICTGKNIGFGAAHNVAIIRNSKTKYHLVLNPDVQFQQGVLEELYAFLELNGSIGLVMPRVLYPDGALQNLCKRLPTPADILAKRLFTGRMQRFVQRRLSAFELCNMDMNQVLSVPYLSGCFMLLRKTALDEVGGFDERFFMYFEDLDLSRRIHQRYDTVYYPRATIQHRHDKGSYKSIKLLLYGIHSAIKYFNKWGWFYDKKRERINRAIGPKMNLLFPEC
jgi:GT2 family glycosyltransferase